MSTKESFEEMLAGQERGLFSRAVHREYGVLLNALVRRLVIEFGAKLKEKRDRNTALVVPSRGMNMLRLRLRGRAHELHGSGLKMLRMDGAYCWFEIVGAVDMVRSFVAVETAVRIALAGDYRKRRRILQRQH